MNSTLNFRLDGAKLPKQLLFSTNKAINRGFGKQNEFYKHISCCNNPHRNVTLRLCSHRRISSAGKDKE